MTPDQADALARIVGVLTAHDTELAEKLRDVTEALVAADAVLSERLDTIEMYFNADLLLDDPSATQPAPPKRRWWRL
jgi:hypothetical protein